MTFGSSTQSVTSAFGDFWLSTTKKTYSSPDKFTLEFTKPSYLLRRLRKGNKGARQFQNGASIQDYIIFDEGGRGQRYDPNGELTPENRQGMVLHDAPWTFTSYDLTWTKHELTLQGGGKDADGQFAVFKRVKAAKLAMLKGRFANSTEADLFAVPNTTTMESRTGALPQEPMPISAMVNEFASGLFPSYSPGGVWTTKQTIAPATRTAWDCVRKTYLDDIANLASGADYDLFHAMQQAEEACTFEGMPFADDTDDLDSDSGPQLWICSQEGRNNVALGLRKANNYTRSGGKDPSYTGPVFNGKPIVSIFAMNTATLYPNAAGTALVAENDATVVGRSGGTALVAPRFKLLNLNAMAMIWHSENYFMPNEDGPVSPYRQPHVKTLWYDTWGNTFWRSLRHHAEIYPGGTLI